MYLEDGIVDVKIQEEEVEQVKWASKDAINDLIKRGDFLPPHIEFFEYCLEYITEN